MVMTGTFPAMAAPASILAQQPQRYTDRVTDYTGTLGDSEITEINSAIDTVRTREQKEIFVVILNSFEGVDPETWTRQALTANGSGNVLIYAVAPSEGTYGILGGSQWTASQLDAADRAARAQLQQGNIAGSAVAVAESLGGGGSGASAAWLGAGAAGVAAAGGGIWAYSRRQGKRKNAATLEDARSIDPADSNRLISLPMQTLEDLAEEELSSTDESIRRGKEELELAQSEFGVERTRSFTRAMNHSVGTLQNAFQIKQRLHDSIPETEAERRSMLVEIISSCGQADAALDAEAENFSQMRNLLLTAGTKLNELTQRTIDLRTRLPKAQQTLDTLRGSYDAAVLESIDHNVDLASAALDEAEKTLSLAQRLEEKPAGQQGGLVDAIRDSEHAIATADRLLSGVENADENIATARAHVGDLISEIEDEIREAGDIKQRAATDGTKADWESLDRVVRKAVAAVQSARSDASADPLGTYTELTDIDSALDEQLDTVRATAADQARQLQIFDQQLQSAAKQIQGAEDLVSTRGRIIQTEARTHLANAQRLYAQAQQQRTSDTRQAIDFARQSAVAAQRATASARSDIKDYNNRNNRGGGAGGAIVTGMVISSAEVDSRILDDVPRNRPARSPS